MLDKLAFLEEKYEDLSEKISEPDVINDQNLWRKLIKEHSSLEEIVTKYREYKKAEQGLNEAKEIIRDKSADEEFKEMAKMEIHDLEEQIEALEAELKILLLPKDPNDDKDVIVEIRAGAGGDEAGLFAADLFRMYTRYAESVGWKVELMSGNDTGVGGYKEVIFMIKGNGAYSKLKYESGVHRVQRIPSTESGGRIHTSTITVAVLPEVDDVDFELELIHKDEINEAYILKLLARLKEVKGDTKQSHKENILNILNSNPLTFSLSGSFKNSVHATSISFSSLESCNFGISIK